MSSGKVKCTCGWSWNKSDSSKKDMYICHECGRDNSNNIPKAQDGIQRMSSNDKRKINLLLKETEKAEKDKKELIATGQIKNPRSIQNQKNKKDLDKKKTYLTQDSRSDVVKEIDREKGQAKEDKKQLKKNIIVPLDVATDIMQLGNFVPNPIGQGIGKIGNILGAGIDAYQAYDALSEGEYVDAAINAGSVLLPMGLDAKTFRRNSKYLQPGQPLYPFSPQARGSINRVNYIEPFNDVKGMTNTSLLANRALLGTLGAETVYDIPKQKNGGWLDNYNDSETSAPEGFEGEGYSNVGRDYSPAWGGQFQMGGSVYPVNYVPEAQDGDTINNATQEGIDFVQSIYRNNSPSTMFGRLPFNVGAGIGLLQSNINDQPERLSDQLGVFPNPYAQAASYIALYAEKEKQNLEDYAKRNLKNNGLYKLMKEKTDRETINDKKIDNTYVSKPEIEKIKTNIKQTPYIENKDINTKVIDNTSVGRSRKGFQTGGALPGATGKFYARYEQGGDIDFSYPRTKGIPSNGPYAKKTKASAQTGVRLDMYGAPITAIEVNDPSVDRTYYDDRTNRMMLGNDFTGWIKDENLQDEVKTHENYHAKQFNSGRYNYDIAHNTDQKQWAEMQKKPQMMSTSNVWGNYYNRKGKELEKDLQTINENYPELGFLPDELLVDKIIDNEQYSNPNSMEGEAMYYENTGKDFYKLQNGGWLDSYEQGGIIKDDRGQWGEHKGEPTRINQSNSDSFIDMGPDPLTGEPLTQPLLGISDKGERKIMYPGEKHKYKKGTKYVDEFPIAKNGLRQEQKGLVNLDQLTNFTNYNTKQPGGWLDTL